MIAHRTVRWYNNIASARFIFSFKVQIDKKASFCCSVRPFLGVSLWHREKKEVQNMNTDKIYAEQLANQYAPKETSKVIALRKLDAKAKRPAHIFAYTFGIIAALVFGNRL